MPAIIPCIIWGAEAVINLLSNVARAKQFRYLVVTSFSIYVCILGVGIAVSASDYIFAYLIILGLGALVFKIARHYVRAASQLTVLFLVPNSSSIHGHYHFCEAHIDKSIGNSVYIIYKDTNQPVFVYGGYYTSVVYYTKHIPTQVYLNKTDDERWAKARNIMPTITKDEFLDQLPNESNAIVIVPNRNIKDFESSPAAVITKPLGKTNGATIYKVQNNISF